MKKKIIIIIIAIILLLGLFLLFSYSSGTKKFYSNNSELKIDIPKYSLFTKEYIDGKTYSIEFIMFGSEDHIQKELKNIYEKNKNDNYKILEWSYSNKTFYKKAYLVYEI